jgi:hypothetical protein
LRQPWYTQNRLSQSDVGKCFFLGGHYPVPEPGHIIILEPADDVRQFDTVVFHGRPSSKETGEEVTEQLAQVATQGLAQVGVDLGGAHARVPQQDLHEADVDALFQE